jgi:excisionase family DNA binding protein
MANISSDARPTPRLGSISTAAQMLGVSPQTIRADVRKGRLTAYSVGSRGMRVDLDEVAALLVRLDTTPAA